MKFGSEKEKEIRDRYNELVRREYEPQVFKSDFNPFLIASLDGYHKESHTGIEIKVANEKDHQCAAKGKIPEKYYPQLQQQMVVSELDCITYISFHNNDIIAINVDKDQEFISKMA